MRKYSIYLIAAWLFCSIPLFAEVESPADSLIGQWAGQAKHGEQQTEIGFHFSKDDTGEVLVTFDLPSTNVQNVPLGKLKQNPKGFQAGDLPIYFHFEQDGKILAGEFTSSMKNMSFRLAKGVSPPQPSTLATAKKVPQPLWVFETKGQIWSSPTVSDGSIYFGSNDGNLYALNGSGKMFWSFPSGGAIFGRPTVTGDAVYFLSDSGYLFKLDSKTGKEIWRFDTGGGSVKRSFPIVKNSDYDYFSSAATVENGAVFIGSANGSLFAIDETTGKEKWRQQTKGKVRSTPTVYKDLVIAGSWDGSVFAVDKATGRLQWQFDALEPVVSSPVIADGVIYIGSRDSNLFALDAATGHEKWRYFYWLSWVESTGTLLEKILYIGSSDYQQVLALDTRTQKAKWSFDTDGSAWGTPAISSNSVYIGAVGTVGYMADHHGAFFALDRKTGHEKWRFPFEPMSGAFAYGVASSPAIAKDLVVFGGLDGKLYAFSTK